MKNNEIDWEAAIEKEAYKYASMVHNMKIEIPGQIRKIKKDYSEKGHLAAISIGVNYFDEGFKLGALWALEYMSMNNVSNEESNSNIEKSPLDGLFDIKGIEVGDMLTNKWMFNGSEIGYDYEVVEKHDDHICVKELSMGGIYDITPESTCLHLRKK